MAVNKSNFESIKTQLAEKQVTLVAVSKTKSVSAIQELYNLGHRDFGENYVQELVDKEALLPKDINWHFIGHLQTNKVKLIAPFVQLIHGVDSLKLLKEINKQAEKNNRVIDCLLQVHIAQEETKFGLNEEELQSLVKELAKLEMKNVRVCGLMGMASFTTDIQKVRKEFEYLKELFDSVPNFEILSMGMSSDYKTAIEEGSTMVRIGSLLFGEREK
ncbi:MAG TPA: YggS family pyridoxal phosphate-dependent enzyme [Chitinophagaceae bacterium]|nr:YggS family pyridoxal phosphate-dependent enzyme [Chitinophagaceae bacterium]